MRTSRFFGSAEIRLDHANLAGKKPGDPVNIETDILARYVETLLRFFAGLASGRKFSEYRAMLSASGSSALRLDGRIAALDIAGSLPAGVWRGARPVEPPRRLATNVAPLDALLGGGFPRGRLTEIVGASSTGRTAVIHALLAASTRSGEVSAVVDLPDALHPETLRTAGVNLERVLWVRPPALRTGLKCAEWILRAGGFGLLVFDLDLPGLRALPPACWLRLSREAGRAGTVLVLLTPRRLAGSFAAVRLSLRRQRVRWDRCLLEGMETELLLERDKDGMPGRRGEVAVGNES